MMRRLSRLKHNDYTMLKRQHPHLSFIVPPVSEDHGIVVVQGYLLPCHSSTFFLSLGSDQATEFLVIIDPAAQ